MQQLQPYSDEIIKFIEDNLNTDIHTLLLKKSPFEEYSMQEIVAQIKGRKVAQKKFSTLLDCSQYKYPVKLSLEQASSQQTAEYKSTFISGSTFLDLTGGMGIDTYFIGKSFEHITYVDLNEELCSLAQWNLAQLGIENFTVINSKAEEVLGEEKEYDVIYIDPSRRIDGRRKYDINDLVPNVVDLQTELVNVAKKVVVKLSPMQDIKSAKEELSNISEIHYISIKGELKEILFILEKDAETTIEKVVLLGEEKQIIELENHGWVSYGELADYIYIPDAAVMKSGHQDHIAAQFNLSKMNKNTHLYTSSEVVEGYPGRGFAVRQKTQLNKKALLPLLSDKKANVISKNHPLKPEEIQKKLKIKDGGDDYLIAFTDGNDKKIIAVCRKL